MSEYMSGEELWSKYDETHRKYHTKARRLDWSDMAESSQGVWNTLAAELKVPRQKVPTLTETFYEWDGDNEIAFDEGGIEILRQRLNAAHEAKERKP